MGVDDLSAMEYAIIAIDERIWGNWSTEWDEDAFAPFSHAERVFSMIHYLDCEVTNGGFHQWIRNPTGMYVRETRDALHEIGATDVAALVERAMALFPGGCPAREYAARFQQCGELTQEEIEILNAMDEPFEEARRGLLSALLSYWHAHERSRENR